MFTQQHDFMEYVDGEPCNYKYFVYLYAVVVLSVMYLYAVVVLCVTNFCFHIFIRSITPDGWRRNINLIGCQSVSSKTPTSSLAASLLWL